MYRNGLGRRIVETSFAPPEGPMMTTERVDHTDREAAALASFGAA
jgi:hypothetical protein